MKRMRRVSVCGVDALVAESFFERAKGLIGYKDLPPGEGMLILKCNAIHTFFMKFAIDAVFLDKNDRVVKRVENIRPGRLFVWGGFSARKVLEVKSRNLL